MQITDILYTRERVKIRNSQKLATINFHDFIEFQII